MTHRASTTIQAAAFDQLQGSGSDPAIGRCPSRRQMPASSSPTSRSAPGIYAGPITMTRRAGRPTAPAEAEDEVPVPRRSRSPASPWRWRSLRSGARRAPCSWIHVAERFPSAAMASSTRFTDALIVWLLLDFSAGPVTLLPEEAERELFSVKLARPARDHGGRQRWARDQLPLRRHSGGRNSSPGPVRHPCDLPR